jgi:hypothetical protein
MALAFVTTTLLLVYTAAGVRLVCGRTKTITLSAAEVDEVAAALARYEAAKDDLDAQAEAGLARLRSRRQGSATMTVRRR